MTAKFPPWVLTRLREARRRHGGRIREDGAWIFRDGALVVEPAAGGYTIRSRGDEESAAIWLGLAGASPPPPPAVQHPDPKVELSWSRAGALGPEGRAWLTEIGAERVETQWIRQSEDVLFSDVSVSVLVAGFLDRHGNVAGVRKVLISPNGKPVAHPAWKETRLGSWDAALRLGPAPTSAVSIAMTLEAGLQAAALDPSRSVWCAATLRGARQLWLPPTVREILVVTPDEGDLRQVSNTTAWGLRKQRGLSVGLRIVSKGSIRVG